MCLQSVVESATRVHGLCPERFTKDSGGRMCHTVRQGAWRHSQTSWQHPSTPFSLSDRPSEHSCVFSKTQSSHIPLTPITQPPFRCQSAHNTLIDYLHIGLRTEWCECISLSRQQNWTDFFCSIVFGMRIDYKRQPFHTISKQLWQYDCFVNNGAP